MIVESKIVPIDSIRPNNYNPNSMRPNIYSFLKKSIKKRGFVQPIVVTKDGVIIDGEHRWKALKELGEPEVEVKVLDLTEAEAKAETLNFNLTKGTFDIDKLGKMLLELDSAWGKDLLKENLVMEQKQIDKAIRAHQVAENFPEDVSATNVPVIQPTTIKQGDMFGIGPHTLRCGDSTDIQDVEALRDGNEVNMVLTDPPYNVGYKYNEHKDDMDEQSYEEFCKAYVNVALAVSPFVAITTGNRNEKYYFKNFDVLGSAFWYKGFALTPGTICRAMVVEPILFFGEKPKGKMLDTDHLDYHTDREVGLLDAHSCPKPIDLFKELITTFTDTGDVVLDLFGGSGTTLIVSELTNRICYIQEKDPQYCQSILDRYERQFGVKATKL
jgi:hypothetical protein